MSEADHWALESNYIPWAMSYVDIEEDTRARFDLDMKFWQSYEEEEYDDDNVDGESDLEQMNDEYGMSDIREVIYEEVTKPNLVGISN